MRVSFLLLAVAALVAADQPSKTYGPPSYGHVNDKDKYSRVDDDNGDDRDTFTESASDRQIDNSAIENVDPATGIVSLSIENSDFDSTGADEFSTSDSSFDSTGEDGFSTSASSLNSPSFEGLGLGNGFGIGAGSGSIVEQAPEFTSEDGDMLVIEGDSTGGGVESSAGDQSSQAAGRRRRYRWFVSFLAKSTKGKYFTWKQAKWQCAQRGLVLLSIENPFKDFLVKLLLRKFRVPFIWTSGTKRYGKWIWRGGRPIGGPFYYSNWDFTGPINRPQPDNAGGREKCLAVLYNVYSIGARWHDLRCDNHLPFICEEKKF